MSQRLFKELIGVVGVATLGSLPRGITHREFPQHGYYYLSPERQKAVPEALQNRRYEEDCEYAIAFFFHRHLFNRVVQEIIIARFASYFWRQFETHSGITELLPGESYAKDEYTDYVAHWGQPYLAAAYGDWCYDVPTDMVYLETKIAGTAPDSLTAMFPLDVAGPGFLLSKKLYGSHPELKKCGFKWPAALATPFQRKTDYYRWDDYYKSQNRPNLANV